MPALAAAAHTTVIEVGNSLGFSGRFTEAIVPPPSGVPNGSSSSLFNVLNKSVDYGQCGRKNIVNL